MAIIAGAKTALGVSKTLGIGFKSKGVKAYGWEQELEAYYIFGRLMNYDGSPTKAFRESQRQAWKLDAELFQFHKKYWQQFVDTAYVLGNFEGALTWLASRNEVRNTSIVNELIQPTRLQRTTQKNSKGSPNVPASVQETINRPSFLNSTNLIIGLVLIIVVMLIAGNIK